MIGHSTNKDILIERHKHVCDDMKLVNASQNLIENLTNRNKKLNIDDLFEENKNNDNHVDKKEINKDENETIKNDIKTEIKVAQETIEPKKEEKAARKLPKI